MKINHNGLIISERAVRFIVDHIAEDLIRPVVGQTFALEDAAAAHVAMEENCHVGKLVLLANERTGA